MHIISFGASSNKDSINKTFAHFTAKHIKHTKLTLIDLNEFPLPLYSIDLENESGIPDNANKFLNLIKSADVIVISLAEHNGTYTSVFKNLFDWMSRIENKIFNDKKLLLLSTSPGARGGKNVMDSALVRFPFHGANIIGNFSLPQFYENFDTEKGIINATLKSKWEDEIKKII